MENLSLNILLIEDSAIDRDLFMEYLEDSILPIKTIEWATTLMDGIKLSQEKHFDIVLTDLGLPDSQGLEGFKKLHKKIPHTAIIVLTGLNNKNTALEAIQAGAQNYLVKGEVETKILEKVIPYSIERQEIVSQLHKSEDLLKKQKKSLEQFAYLASHDLRAPINNLEILLNMIESENGVKESCSNIFAMTKTAVSNFRNTIDSMIEIVSLNKSNNTEERKEIKFSQTLSDVLAGIQEQIRETETEIESNFNGCDQVKFPPVYLHSIFQNLITNSIKYRKKDIPAKIKIETSVGEKFVCLSIEDNGTGIDMKKNRDKLFGIFQRFHQNINGKGIGLYMLKSIIESYDGKIEVVSKVNQGATFSVLFPID